MNSETRESLVRIIDKELDVSGELVELILKSNNLKINSDYKNTDNAFRLIKTVMPSSRGNREEIMKHVIKTAKFTIEDLKVAEYSTMFINEGLTDRLYERCLITALGFNGLYNSLFEIIEGVYVRDVNLPERNYDEFLSAVYLESLKAAN